MNSQRNLRFLAETTTSIKHNITTCIYCNPLHIDVETYCIKGVQLQLAARRCLRWRRIALER